MLLTKDQIHSQLEKGNVVGIPTDTVWGFATLYQNEMGVEEIYRLKYRSPLKPLILLVRTIDEVLSFVNAENPLIHNVMEKYWPGALTLLLPFHKELVPHHITRGESHVGIRIPHHEDLLSLLAMTGPLATTSLNFSHKPPLTEISEIELHFGKDFPLLISSNTPRENTPSTIIKWEHDHFTLVRSGKIGMK